MTAEALVVATAIAAADEARRQLRDRGRAPDAHAAFVLALEDGVAELLSADPDGAPAGRRYVEQVRDRLEAEPPARHPPTPPRNTRPELIVALIEGPRLPKNASTQLRRFLAHHLDADIGRAVLGAVLFGLGLAAQTGANVISIV